MDANYVFMSIKDKLPKDQMSITLLQNELKKTSTAKIDELTQNLPTLGLKSPALVFWVGSFLFGNLGLGRFMIGDFGLGAARFFLQILAIVMLFVGVSVYGTFSEICLAICSISYLAISVWFIVDLILTGKKLRKKNLNKVLLALKNDSNIALVSICDRLPNDPTRIEKLKQRINTLGEKAQKEVNSTIREDIVNPTILTIVILFVGIGVIIAAYFLVYEWLGVALNNKKVAAIFIIAIMVWFVLLFKGNSIFQDINIETLEEKLTELEKEPNLSSNLGSNTQDQSKLNPGAIAGAAVGAGVATAGAMQNNQSQADNTQNYVNDALSEIKDAAIDKFTSDEEKTDAEDEDDEEGIF